MERHRNIPFEFRKEMKRTKTVPKGVALGLAIALVGGVIGREDWIKVGGVVSGASLSVGINSKGHEEEDRQIEDNRKNNHA